MGNEDKQLLCKLKAGDEKAFRKIYLKYNKELYTVAFKYLRSNGLAEDAVHDIFVKLWDHRKRLNKSGSLSGFLFISLKNHVLNMVCNQKQDFKRKIDIAREKKRDINQDNNVVNLIAYQKMYQEAVEELPEARKRIFELRNQEGLTNREIADYLGLSIHTVKSQYYKATKFIRGYVNGKDHRNTG